MATSPTQRSLAYLRELGYYCEVVEHWNSFTAQRKDLWGWCDILALRRDEVLAVQTTSSAVSARVNKILAAPNLNSVREAGIKIHVHGWIRQPINKTRKKVTYKLRIEDLS